MFIYNFTFDNEIINIPRVEMEGRETFKKKLLPFKFIKE